MAPGPNIVSIGNAFAQQVIGLILPIQQEEFHLPLTVEGQPDLLDIDRSYHGTGGGFWGAIMYGRLTGTIGLINIENHRGVLRKFFVAKDCRGKENGIAQRLLEALLTHCDSAGITDIYLGTIDTMKAARRFYERNGFVQVGQSQLPAGFPIVPVDNTFYHLHLTERVSRKNMVDRSGILAIGTRLQRLSDQLRRDAWEIYRLAGIPFEPKWFPVIYVLDQQSPLSVMEIADGIGYTHPSTISLLQQLEKEKLIHSARDKSDSRRRLIRLTPKGQDLIGRMKPVWQQMTLVLSDLTHTPHALLTALNEVEDRLEKQSFLQRTKHLL